jgi:hypothetical protein
VGKESGLGLVAMTIPHACAREVIAGQLARAGCRLNHSTHRKQVPAEQHFVFAVIRSGRGTISIP